MTDPTEQFARNRWYAAAWLGEIGEQPLGRRILGEGVVLFRDASGAIHALHDMCPHRLVPLSMGTVTELGLQCGYHGMTFDGSGACVRIPGVSCARIRLRPLLVCACRTTNARPPSEYIAPRAKSACPPLEDQ